MGKDLDYKGYILMDSLDNKSRQKLPSSQKFRTRQDIVE